MTSDVRRALLSVFIARTVANGGLRVVYPFLPVIARGLQVPLPVLGAVVALRNLGGLTTPLAARGAEALGRRRMMIGAMVGVAVGCAMTAATDVFWVAALGVVAVGIAKPTFDIPMQAWFGDRVSRADQGRVFGITELTWSAALFVTVPSSGYLITATSWRAPFVLVAVLAVFGAAAVAAGIRSDAPRRRVARPVKVTRERALVLAASVLFSVASEIPFVVYGRWLEGSFSLTVSGIGLFTIVVVVAELIGEGVVVAVGDRVGIRRLIVAGLALSALAYLSFAVTGESLMRAVATVSLWIAAFEVSVVATIPFVSELGADSRDRLLSLLAVSISIGRAVGAASGPLLYRAGGIGLVGVVSSLCALAAMTLVLRVAEPARQAGLTPKRLP